MGDNLADIKVLHRTYYATYVHKSLREIKDLKKKHRSIYKRYWKIDRSMMTICDVLQAFTVSGLMSGGVFSDNYSLLCVTAAVSTLVGLLRVLQASFGLRDQWVSHMITAKQYSDLDRHIELNIAKCRNSQNGEYRELAQSIRERICIIQDTELPVSTPESKEALPADTIEERDLSLDTVTMHTTISRE